MKSLFIPLSLALASCNMAALPAPNTVADRTTQDERRALEAEYGYQLWANVALITGAARKQSVKAADLKAYAAVKAVRAAYEAGNATSYEDAADKARDAIEALKIVVKGG